MYNSVIYLCLGYCLQLITLCSFTVSDGSKRSFLVREEGWSCRQGKEEEALLHPQDANKQQGSATGKLVVSGHCSLRP